MTEMSGTDQFDLCLGRLTRLETRIYCLRIVLQSEGRDMRDYAFDSKQERAIAAAKAAAAAAIELEELLPQQVAAREALDTVKRQA